MWGFIQLSGVGIIVLGGVIELIIYSIPHLRFLATHPLLAFGAGIVIAYLLDDFSNVITSGDTIVITLMIVTLIIMVIPMLKEWLKNRKEKLDKIHSEIAELNNKISKIEGQMETILHIYPKKKK